MTVRVVRRLASQVLRSTYMTEPGIILRDMPGMRNEYGEWVEGSTQEDQVTLTSYPTKGQDRLTVSEGLRSQDMRTFLVQGDLPTLRAGQTDGDDLLQGRLGTADNVFPGDTQAESEELRDAYATANPAWLAEYQADAERLIKLTGFGAAVYQRWAVTANGWVNQPLYKVIMARRWGAFTEVMGVHSDNTD